MRSHTEAERSFTEESSSANRWFNREMKREVQSKEELTRQLHDRHDQIRREFYQISSHEDFDD